jgi:hypothetical protein
MFLVLPDPYPFVRGTNPDPAPRILQSSSKKGKKKTSIPTVLWLLTDFLSLKNDPKLASKGNTQKSWGNFFCCCRLQGHGFTALVQTTSSRVWDRGSSSFVVFNRKFDVFSNALLFIKLLLIGTLNLIPRILLMHFITVHPEVVCTVRKDNHKNS